jgi:hypothetical protein
MLFETVYSTDSFNCEAYVPIQIVCSLIINKSGRAARFVCVLMLFLSATNSEASVSTLLPSGQDSLLSEATCNSFVAIDDTLADESESKELLSRKPTLTSATNDQSVKNQPPSPETAIGAASSQTAADEISVPDWNGIWRDTGTFFGTQVVAAGIIYTMPQSVSGWSAEEKKNSIKNYFNNLGDPVIDKDKLYINYVLHPYWGATYYIRGRERGLDKLSAFAYSALISAMYEFGIECFFEKPSIQDLIVTPVAGSLLGAFLFEPLRDSIKRKQELRWYDHVAMVVTDPLGVLSQGIEKVLGIKATVMVNYPLPHMQVRSTGASVASKGSRIGAVMQFSLD